MIIGGMIKERQCSLILRIALCSSEDCVMYYCSNIMIVKRKDFLGKFLAKEKCCLIRAYLIHILCVEFVEKVILTIRGHIGTLCELF